MGNNIPIYIKLPEYFSNKINEYKKEVYSLENRKKRKDKLDKESIVKQIISDATEDSETPQELNPDILSVEPVAMLSANELPALLYKLFVEERKGQERTVIAKQIEQLLINKIKSKILQIENYDSENTEYVSDIPKTLQQAKKTATIDREKLTRALEDEIATTQKRHKELKATKNTQGEYRLKKKAKGEMASWLAKDLIRLMPHPYRAQWKGYQHRQLQAALAFYHKRERRDALDLLCSVWDFTKDKDFHYKSELKRAFDTASSFENLLFKYFDLRKNMLKAMHTTATTEQTKLFNKGAKQQRLWTFFNKRRYTIDEFDKLKAKILAKPLVFDRGIFDDKPTYERDVKYEDSPEIFADWYRYAQEYKNYQAFYDKELYPRDYSKLYELEEAKGKELTDKTKLFTRLTRDRKIKQNQIQDLFLKLIAEDLGQKVFGLSTSDSAITLSEVFTSQAERINQRAAARSQSKRKKGDYSENKIKESYIWSKTFPYEYGQIKEPAVKLKDFGKFRQLLEDERVESIFSYNKNRIWSKKEIEEEIQSYETIRREEIFKEIQNFEAYLWQRKDASKPDGIPNFKKDVVNEVLKKLKGKGEQPIEDSDINWLKNTKLEENKVNNLSLQKPLVQKAFFTILIRNKFAHNQLINLFFWKQIQTCYRQYEQTADESISAYLLEALKAFIDEMKKELEKKE